MSLPETGTDAGYAVSCFNCRAIFDALESSWCSCVVGRPTLVCPSCLSCFCRAPQSYKQGFWAAAPPVLWDRAQEAHLAAFQPPPNPEPAEVKRPLVLLADDDKDVQRAAYRAIQSLGYGIVLAHDGEEGLALAAKYRPDLVLTDALMPKLDGREMCLRIKNDAATAGTKVVIMTSLYTGARYKYEAFKEFHADDYLNKPLEFKQLQAVLHKHLESSAGD
jgi:CheY-like chemotaxis protein